MFAGMKSAALFLLAVLSLCACRREYAGELKDNEAPETYMLADTIVRFGDNRYESVVEVQWGGDDPDGYIKGYEVSLDGQLWTYTERQDSSFTLSLPGASDTADFRFYVRAIDNMNLADPTPASLVYPVKNSDPEVHFVIPAGNPTRSFPAVKYFWTGSDPDGDASLDHYELVWNDTTVTPIELSPSFSEAGIVADNISGATSPCTVYPGTLTTPHASKLNGMKLDDKNILYIRAVDKVGATSDWIAAPEIFIRKPVSDILLINAQRSSFNRANVQNFYAGKIFQALNKSFDTLQAGPEGATVTDLSPDPITQDRVFSFFKKIFVYSENSEFVLSLMQKTTTRFFQQGGKLLLITEGNDVIEDQPAYLDFAPAAAYSARPANVSLLFNLNDSLYGASPGYPALLNTSQIISGLRPLELAQDNSNYRFEALYKGVITQDSSGNIGIWKGNSVLGARRVRKSDNNTDFILMMVPIYVFENNASMDSWFDRILNTELKF